MQELQVLEHLDKRVLTTQQIAEAFGTKAKVITRNFQRNNDHYEQGVHYFALTGEFLKQFKGSRQDDVTLKFVSVLYLWTEQGAWLHAKSLNSDKAWQAYNMLITNYYQIKKQIEEESQTLAISYKQFQQIERRVETLEQLVKNVTLHSGEQLRLRKAVGARVCELTDNQGARQALFRSIYAALKERYHVGSYRDIKQYQLQDALRFVEKWGK
ncbi:ORF6N domain-containing protein [Ureibacillus sp. 179-F W5.1 NHS]|uniref:ORF6N domain-containing protein n=1 Tax=Ureibacillus sp. 179-F W5.1 NHS TaxID=3374297 RepID=UPI0038791BA4